MSDYDQHVGQEILLFGTVTTVDEETLAIRTATSNGPLELTVPNITASVETGGTVQVYGTLQPNHTIAPGTVSVVNPTANSPLYKHAVSAVGAVVILVVFFRHWIVDTIHSLAVRSLDNDGSRSLSLE